MPHRVLAVAGALMLGAAGLITTSATPVSAAKTPAHMSRVRATSDFTYVNQAFRYSVRLPRRWKDSRGGAGITLTHATVAKDFSTRAFIQDYPIHDALIVVDGLVRQPQVSFSAIDKPYHVPNGVRVLHYSLKELPRTHGGYRIQSVEQKGATLYYNLGIVTRQNVVEVQVIVPNVASYRVMAQRVLKSFHTT